MPMRLPAAYVHRALRTAAGVALFSALAACGYKGPLYMPPPPPPDASLTTPPRAASLPEPEADDQANPPATPQAVPVPGLPR